MSSPKKMNERLPDSEWHLEYDGVVWRLYPTGNSPHILLGPFWTEKQARIIARLVEDAYDMGAVAVQDDVKKALRIGEP